MVLLAHQKRYPLMQIEDHLKLLYQHTFGARHLHHNPDLDMIKAYLVREMTSVDDKGGSPWLEDIGEGYARIHLHAVKRGVMTADELVSLFGQTVMQSPERDDQLMKTFIGKTRILMRLIQAGKLPFDVSACQVLLTEMAMHDWPPFHHSDIYRTTYQPHYRVVLTCLLPNDFVK